MTWTVVPPPQRAASSTRAAPSAATASRNRIPVGTPCSRTSLNFSVSGTPRIEPSRTKTSFMQAGPRSLEVASGSSTKTRSGVPATSPVHASNETGPCASACSAATAAIAAAIRLPATVAGSSRRPTAAASSASASGRGWNCGKTMARTSSARFRTMASRSTPSPRFITGTPTPYSASAEGEYSPKVATSTQPIAGWRA